MQKENEFSLEKCWEYENGFYLTSHVTRISKLLAHFELYKMIVDLPGAIVECGVFKGASFIRFATFRQILESPFSRKLIGFDAFGKFPHADRRSDREFIERFEDEAGAGFSRDYIQKVLSSKGFENFELIEGDIRDSVPEYVQKHDELKIALLHVDVDVYEPTVVILTHLFDRIVRGGLLVLDDYSTIPGETRAVDEFLNQRGLGLKKLSISHIPSFARIGD